MNRDIETLSTDPKYKKLVEVPRKEWDQWKESWGPSQNIKNFLTIFVGSSSFAPTNNCTHFLYIGASKFPFTTPSVFN